jgi:polar amino acid transport system substrate-binding protein
MEAWIMKKKNLFACLMALVMVMSLAACGAKEETPEAPADDAQVETEAPETAESDKAYIEGNGSMIIGYTVYAPMNYTDENGEFTGFDTELAKLVCEKLGVEPTFQEIDWSTKEVELAGKSIDCIWNGMTLNEERETNMNCTQPYVKNAQVVVVKDGTDYTDTASLAGQTVVAEIGSAGEEQVMTDAGLAQADYIGKSVQTDCLMEVKAGTAAAAVLDMTLAKAMIGEGTDYEELVIVDELAVENYGVAFRKGSDLCAELNKFMDKIIADGTFKALGDKYDLSVVTE